ncbi:MAG: TIGR03085 family metal-binding protein [Mycobacteriales bacterium]
MSLAGRERADLLALLGPLGPDAPTLCEGWTTHDLAAHLVARERRPLALPGLVVAPLHPLTERYERQARRTPYEDLLKLLEKGPPLWSPVRAPVANVHELFVHHEDVRRPAGLGPRRLDGDLEDALWERLAVLGPALTRRAKGLGITLVTPGARSLRVRRGADEVVLRGEVGELFLWLFGRRGAAQVTVEGADDAVARANAADLRF